jgi:hypothetical protein
MMGKEKATTLVVLSPHESGGSKVVLQGAVHQQS